jgi:hypothetical protein
MSEKDTLGEVKAKQGLLSKIEDILFFGKGTREDLKEFDKQLREDYHNMLRGQRRDWENTYLQVLDAGQPLLNRRFKAVLLSYDRVMAKINRASYGYAPMFNRRGGIGQTELARAFGYDKQFGGQLTQLGETANKATEAFEAGDWRAASTAVAEVKARLEDVEKQWKEREKAFRPAGE